MTEIEKLEKKRSEYYNKIYDLNEQIKKLELADYYFEGKYIYVPNYGYMHVKSQKHQEKCLIYNERMFFQGLYFNSEYFPYDDANWFDYTALTEWNIPIRTFYDIKSEIKILTKEEFIKKFKEFSSHLNENFDKMI